MFNVPTTIVLGAGAHKDFGFPLGETLKTDIADALQFRTRDALTDTLQRVIPRIDVWPGAAGRVAKAITNFDSIDDCLLTHSDDRAMVDVGKLGIAKVLAQYERNSSVSNLLLGCGHADFRKFMDKSWMGRFAKLLVTGIKKSDAASVFENITIVDFNYDRSTYVLLTAAIQNAFQTSLTDAQKIVQTLNIFHPYGSLGNLYGQDGHRFEWGLPTHNLEEAAENLRVYTEPDAGAEFLGSNATERLARSKHIVFLGFGYHQQNIDILEVRTLQEKLRGQTTFPLQTIFACMYGIKPTPQRAISNSLGEPFYLVAGGKRLGRYGDDCYKFLENFGREICG